MRVYKATYKDRNGNLQKSAKWYVDIFDYNQLRHKIPVFSDKWLERTVKGIRYILAFLSFGGSSMIQRSFSSGNRG
jgi:hypothetical protein